MSRGAQTFKQGDVTKAVKGAVNAGLAVSRVEIEKNGKIVVFVSYGGQETLPMNEWDAVK